MPKRNPRLAEVIRRHLHIHLVADADADEVLAHLARNVREHFVSVGEGHSKHRARENLGHRAGQLNWFFFSHAETVCALFLPLPPSEINTETGGVISIGLSRNLSGIFSHEAAISWQP